MRIDHKCMPKANHTAALLDPHKAKSGHYMHAAPVLWPKIGKWRKALPTRILAFIDDCV